jgi:hypothetical protein
MVARQELSGWRLTAAGWVYTAALIAACVCAWALDKLGAHKQLVNRLIEPFGWVYTLVTATDTYDDSGEIVKPWEHFFGLRCAADAEPHIRILAHQMRTAYAESIPEIGTTHAPFGDLDPGEFAGWALTNKLKVCAMRCARISYFAPGKVKPEPVRDLARIEGLIRDGHHSPLEHVGVAADGNAQWGTQRGWKSLRYIERDARLMESTR